MSNLTQIPTDYKKYLDQTLHHYLPKMGKIRGLFNNVDIDSAETTPEYVRQTQTYAAATGFTSFSAPEVLADGSRAVLSSIGTEDATSTVLTYAEGYRIDRKLLSSGKPLVQQYITQHATESVNRIEVDINNTLLTNMASNASQSYTATATWSTTGDSVGDIIDAKAAFKDSSGGVDADFLVLHTNEWADLMKDQRMQSTDYIAGKPLESGSYVSRPLGLEVLPDTGLTTGTFLLGKRGMFGNLMIGENFKTFEYDEAEAGKSYAIIFSYIDQYQLPYYIMSGSGI